MFSTSPNRIIALFARERFTSIRSGSKLKKKNYLFELVAEELMASGTKALVKSEKLLQFK